MREAQDKVWVCSLRVFLAAAWISGAIFSGVVHATEDRDRLDAGGEQSSPRLHEFLRGNVEIEVTVPGSGRIDTHNDLPLGDAVAFGVASVPLLAIQSLINPFALLGAVVYPIAGPMASQDFATKDAAIRNAAASEDYSSLLRDSLRDALGQKPIMGPTDGALKVVLHAYGLQSRSGKAISVLRREDDLCLTVHASYAVLRQGRELVRDSIDIGVVRRSVDAPVPLCEKFAKFAEDNGNYLRLAIRESAAVLAALIAARLGVGQ